MKKIITFVICIMSFFTVVSAQEMNLYFNPNGGKPKTSGFTLNDNNGFIVYGSSAYATYKGGSTIKKINSISGKSFTLTKSGDSLVSGREWYLKNVNDGKIYYFSQSKTYKVNDVLKKLSYEEDESFVSIDLYANWNSKPKTGGVDISGGSGDSTSKPKSLKVNAQKSSIMVGEKTTVSATFSPSGTSEKVTWSTSNKKVATVSSSGVVTGVKKGTVTITGKSASGLKATVKVKVTKVPSGTHYSIIQFHMNGGSLSSSHGKSISSSGSYILRDNSKDVHKFAYGNSTTKKGLADWDNKNYINITKNGYVAVSGKEWNTKPDGSGKSYGDHKVYKASDFCDSSKKDCTVTLYVNWTKNSTSTSSISVSPTTVTLKVGETKKVKVTTTGDVPNTSAVWTVKDSKIASVTNGTIKGLSKGSTFVTVTIGPLKATVSVTVTGSTTPSVKTVDNRGKKLKKLGKVDLSSYKNNCIHVPSKNEISSAQGFTVAGKYYIAAKRNSSESKATLYVISMNSSRKSKKDAKIVSEITKSNYFGHANAVAYNPNTGKVYITKTTNGKYKTFPYSKITSSSPVFSEGSIQYIEEEKVKSLDPGGIEYSSYDNKFYLGSGWKLMVFDSSLTTHEMLIYKAARGTTQDIGAYNGNFLVVRWNPGGPVGGSNLETTRNAIDVYSGSTGLYKGTYIIKSAAEMEGISYNPNTGKFAFYMQNVNGDDFDCIQEASMNIS